MLSTTTASLHLCHREAPAKQGLERQAIIYEGPSVPMHHNNDNNLSIKLGLIFWNIQTKNNQFSTVSCKSWI